MAAHDSWIDRLVPEAIREDVASVRRARFLVRFSLTVGIAAIVIAPAAYRIEGTFAAPAASAGLGLASAATTLVLRRSHSTTVAAAYFFSLYIVSCIAYPVWIATPTIAGLAWLVPLPAAGYIFGGARLGRPLWLASVATLGLLTAFGAREGPRWIAEATTVLVLIVVVAIVSAAFEREREAAQAALGGQLHELARAETALRLSEERYRNLEQTAADAIISVRHDGTIASWNRGAERMFGRTSETMLGRDFTEMVPERLRAAYWRLFRSLVEGRSSRILARSQPFVGVDADGREIPIEGAISEWNTDEGRFFGAILRDVTERVAAAEHERELLKATTEARFARETAQELASTLSALETANAELIAAQDELRQSSKLAAMGQLAGGVAHDFNNMLTVILGSAEFLRRGLGPDHKHAADVERVVEAAERNKELTQQLLTFSRKEPYRPRRLDLNPVLREMQVLMVRTLGDSVRVRLRVDPMPCQIFMDRGHLGQIILNLAVNARDAMPPGGGTLTFRTARIVVDGEGCIEFEAIDDGEGMPAEVAERAFEPFFTTKDVGRGTGMGLATVYGIVQRAGGAIDIRSEHRRGTTVRIVLPVASRTGETPIELEELPEYDAADAAILIVEDEPLVLQAANRTLASDGFRVLTAEDAASAIRIVRSAGGDDIRLVLTDVAMAGSSGIQLAASLQRLRPGLPVVYMSGHTPNPERGPLPQPFLAKPFTARSLLSIVRRTLRGAAPTGPHG